LLGTDLLWFFGVIFAQRVDLNVNRKERGFKDDQPDVITHGVTGRLSYYGLGVKTATFQLGDKGKRGFVTRTKSKGKPEVSECAFSDELIATAESRGHKWLEAAVFHHEGSALEYAKQGLTSLDEVFKLVDRFENINLTPGKLGLYK
jgi:hypothetical protein